MRRPPPWLLPLVERLRGPAGGQLLWLGPALAVDGTRGWTQVSAGAELPEGPFASVFVAAAPGDLADSLRALRPRCEPGAVVCLLLPERLSGVGAKLQRMVDPMGRAGRKPHTMPELCAALLEMGTESVTVVRARGRLRAVYAQMPVRRCTLDAAFDVAFHATC